ncbi:hypothetical protein BASA50_005064 [Batrachochytrium salamandrivorans]|uniref:Glutathione S-transferase n=1 Tax=Batrachochytrium salamandrivorans TaxID=1357716 RepID=A0ABQ8FDT7_9FUNG|nr:hypothetical protein BASA60_003005 [Batrachochytrium salamandrivorans]KAH6596514.1 hypothetical protein BASA50_005064 [Batrachochytrium salamandrivorans]KAH6597578.1 hypothetical protein BASA61_003108 [Batrachochytrium salamandrivorans]KAH9245570.1 hypothetical protein BASA81_016929 [Batrachochytrium salamandrivorans]KAH9272920.1 hypothetical protein BASA83_004813 [Batrachochytrium salamandrivorans]
MTPALPSLKLTYFGIRARAEASRLALYVGGVPFEDERVSGEGWGAMKQATPFGQLPLLTINGSTQIAQSNAILRYAGSLGGLYPAADPIKAALVDQIVMHIEDMSNTVYSTVREKDPEVKMQQRKVIAQDKYPAMFKSLEQVIEKHSSGKWAVGDSISVADLAIYVLIVLIKTGIWDGVPVDVADSFVRVSAVYTAVLTHPKVAEWEAAHAK